MSSGLQWFLVTVAVVVLMFLLFRLFAPGGDDGALELLGSARVATMPRPAGW